MASAVNSSVSGSGSDMRRIPTLRANKRETTTRLKFTLEGTGERTHGYAFTDTPFAGCSTSYAVSPTISPARVVSAPVVPTAELQGNRFWILIAPKREHTGNEPCVLVALVG